MPNVAKLRPPHYHGFSVVCHANTRRSAGWLLCRHSENGKCEVEKSLDQSRTGKGGTTKLERHTKAHKSSSSTVRFLTSLPVHSKTKVAHAAALVVALDIRPLSFCDKHPGMRQFSNTIFELGQTIPVSERINPKCYLPGQTAVTSVVGEISKSIR